ncbi:MAG: O-antigen ligase family protein [Melioribacteraceae bacterium]
MLNQRNRMISIIDKLIYFFSIVFLLSLTNSIFVNQIGYYFSLIFIVVRFYLTRENPFYKTGLEYAFLFYIAAEILSTVFSIDPAHSFRNLLKRFFLIPIIYTFVYSAKDFESTKRFVLVYLGAALATMLVYLGLSYNYFINNFYQLYESGPSTFQYPITSSELMSFSLVFLFAFLIFEKMQNKYRLIVLVLFTINLLALLATYKRTGWMGAAAGILFVIALGRKWILLIPVLLLLIASAFIEKNISEVHIYDLKQNGLVTKIELKTEGRAYAVLPEGNGYYVSDFENGLVKYQDSNVLEKYNLGSPVVDFKKWQDNFYVANLIDTRFVLMNKDANNKMKRVDEFITPGFTRDWCVSNGFIYVIDSDSGITVFRNPVNLKDRIRFTKEVGTDNEKIFVDSSFVILFSKSNELSVFSLKNSLPDKLIITKKFSDRSDLIFYKDSKLIIAEDNRLKLYSIESDKIVTTGVNEKISGAFNAIESENKLFITTTKKDLVELELPLNKLTIKSFFNLGFVPKSIAYGNGNLFASQVKRSRLLSSVDLYIPSNFSRLALWRAGWLIFKDHPLVGVGDIDLAELYKQYKRNFDKEIQGHLHNNYIHLLVTLGIFGFIAVIFLLLRIFIIHIKNYSILKDEPFAASYALGAAGSFVAFLVSGLTEWNFGDHEIITMVWFMLALSIAFVKGQKNKITLVHE